MRISVYLPWLMAAALALATPALARRLQPRLAATALAATATATAVATTWGLVLLAAALPEHTPPVEERTSTRPVPLLISLAAGGALLFIGQRARRTVTARRATTAALRRVCNLCADAGELAVTDDPAVYAFAVPARPGRILISRGLLTTTTNTQRRVVIAHERAHLRQRHSLLRAATDLAAATNPLLTGTRNAVAFLVERAADEAAAHTVQSRPDAARALADVALRTDCEGEWPGYPRGRPSALAFHRHAVLDRIAALHQPPIRSVVALAPLCFIGSTLTLAAASDATLALSRVAARVLGI